MTERIPNWDRADVRCALALFGLALALRVVTAVNLPVVSQDAWAYLGFARDMKVGAGLDYLRSAIQPAYPAMILLADTWIENDLLSAHVISVLFSSLGLLPLFALVRDMCDRRTAILTGLFYATLPRILYVHPDIFSDGLFHFLFLTTTALLWHGVTRTSILAFSLAGFTASLAFYTRTEGMYLAAASLGLPLIALLVDRNRPLAVRLANGAYGGLAAAIFLLVCSPLFLLWRSGAGEWTPSPRGSAAAAMYSLGEEEEAPTMEWGGARSWPGALNHFQRKFRTVGQEVVPLLILCSFPFLRKRILLLGGIFLLCLFLGYTFPLLAAFVGGYPMVKRYLLLPLIFLLPFAAIGVLGIVERLSRIGHSRGVRISASVLLGIFFAGGGVYGTLPKRSRQRSVVEAARWIQGRLRADATVYANSPRVFPYVHGKVDYGRNRLADWQAIELQEGDYIVVVEQRLEEQAPGALAYLQFRYVQVARFPEDPIADDKAYLVSVFGHVP